MICCFNCPNCGVVKRVVKESVSSVMCKKCNIEIPREFNPPGTKVMEKIDNGLLQKPVERLSEATRLYRERSNSVK